VRAAAEARWRLISATPQLMEALTKRLSTELATAGIRRYPLGPIARGGQMLSHRSVTVIKADQRGSGFPGFGPIA
jgi:hypothetical protein